MMGGNTQITVNERGHLRPEFRRSKTEPWGTFVGTWDLPRKLPGTCVDVPTARRPEAYSRLRQDWEETKFQLTGRPWGTTNNSLYKEGTRALVLRTSNDRSRTNGRDVDSPFGSGMPRKLTPIQRDGQSPAGSEGRPDSNRDRQESYSRIPLPKLDQPVYAEENEDGHVMAAL